MTHRKRVSCWRLYEWFYEQAGRWNKEIIINWSRRDYWWRLLGYMYEQVDWWNMKVHVPFCRDLSFLCIKDWIFVDCVVWLHKGSSSWRIDFLMGSVFGSQKVRFPSVYRNDNKFDWPGLTCSLVHLLHVCGWMDRAW